MNYYSSLATLKLSRDDLNFDDENPQTLLELEICTKVIKNSYAFSAAFEDKSVLSSDEQNEAELYEYIVDLIENSIDFNSINCKKYLLMHHVQQVFRKDEKTHKRVLDNVIKEPGKHPLTATLVRTENLISKKSKGFADPFYVLYLESCQNKWYLSTTKFDTENPIWDETFEFNISLKNFNVLCVQVWYQKVHKERKMKDVLEPGLKCGSNPMSYLKKHGHKFVGQCKIPLKAVPLTDEILIYTLTKSEAMPQSRGNVAIKFHLKDTTEMDIRRHEQMLQSLLLYEVKTLESKYWMGNWCYSVDLLLQQHLLHRNLAVYWDRLLKWFVYVRVHQKYPISIQVFYDLLLDLVELMQNKYYTPENVAKFWNSTRVLLHSCIYFVQKIRDMTFNGELYDIAVQQTKHIMRLFSLLSKMDSLPADIFCDDTIVLCVIEYCSDAKEKLTLRKALELALIQVTEKRLQQFNNVYSAVENADDQIIHSQLIYYRRFVHHLIQDITFSKTMTELFAPIFEFSYIDHIYVLCTEYFTSICSQSISQYNNSIDSYSPIYDKTFIDYFFDLYFKIQQLVDLGNKYCAEKKQKLKIIDYHCWFAKSVAYFFTQCRQYILQEVDTYMKSHSIQDFDIFTGPHHIEHLQKEKNLLINRWLELRWPDADFYFQLLMMINQYLFEYYKLYADELINKYNTPKTKKKLGLEGSYIVISNVDYIIRSAKDHTKHYVLRVDDLSRCTSDATFNQQAMQNYATACNSFIDEQLRRLQSKLDSFIQNYVFESEPQIRRHMNEIDKIITNDYSTALRDCKVYIYKLWSQPLGLVSNGVYVKLKYEIKKLALNSLYETICKRKKITPLYLYNMNEVFKKILLCLEPDDTEDDSDIEVIKSSTRLHLAKTDDLIEKYLAERFQKQDKLITAAYGTLSVLMSFHEDDLNITVLNYSSINSVDRYGKPKFYVKVKLYPYNEDRSVEKCKTDHGKPFPQDFKIRMIQNAEIAWICLEVYNKHKLKHVYIGDVILSVKSIQIDQCIKLPLSRPEYNNIYHILERRKEDDKVAAFLLELKAKCNNAI